MTTAIDRPSLIAPDADDVSGRALIAALSPRFSNLLGQEFVIAAVQEALAEVRANARIQQFVPLIAHRVASDRLRQAENALVARWAGQGSTTSA